MIDFWKMAAIAILTVIFSTTISKTEKDISLVLSIAASSLVLLTAMRYLSELIDFLWQMNNNAVWKNPFLEPLLKISGIALMTELTSLISSDAGHSSLGKAMQILGNTVILVLTIPVFESFFAVVQELLRII
mgnify:FL=1